MGLKPLSSVDALELGLIDSLGKDGMHQVMHIIDDDLPSRNTTSYSNYRGLRDTNRKLVFYTDEYPSTVLDADNAICGRDICLIITQQTCVLLEEGDDREEVRAILVLGIEAATTVVVPEFGTTKFVHSIPDEHNPFLT